MGAPTQQDIEDAIFTVKFIFGLILAAAILISMGVGGLLVYLLN